MESSRSRRHLLWILAVAVGVTFSGTHPAAAQPAPTDNQDNQASQETQKTIVPESDAAAEPPHDLVIKPADRARTLRATPGQPPAGALGDALDEESAQKSGAFSRGMMNLRSQSADTLENVVPYASTVLSGPEFTLFGGRYGFRIELRRPRSMPWEAVPPPVDLSGRLDDTVDGPDELDDVLWLPLLQIGFL